MSYNIGIIGQGFVGSAIREGLKDFYNIKTYDIDESKCNATHEEVCVDSEIIFVCLPTPMRKDGSCDTRILQGELSLIDMISPVLGCVVGVIGHHIFSLLLISDGFLLLASAVLDFHVYCRHTKSLL